MVVNFDIVPNYGAIKKGVVWSVSNEAFATVDSQGTVTILNRVGTVNLTASIQGTSISHTIVLRIV